ncbi:hypothetical protein ACNSPR_27995 [Klebsiella pneumoniae]
MTTLIARAEAKEIMASCEIGTLIWGSPYNRMQQEVPLAVLAERFLYYPDCLSMLLHRHRPDADDAAGLEAIMTREDHYYDTCARSNDLVRQAFAALTAWSLITRITS